MTPGSYPEFVALYANREYLRAASVMDAADAAGIGTGKLEVPPAWIDLVSESQEEREQWRRRRLRD